MKESLVIGTAGHIDHGKTSLVRALTGIDTDRLPEEKKRGISIELGFAHLDLGNGVRVSFIDVPGHERFIRTMLAGAGGMHAVMLIVAADEGIKPQTREHFEICRLLGIQRGFVVLTKCDLASPGQILATRAAVDDLCKGSFLAGAQVLETSSTTGAGLQLVRSALSALVSDAPNVANAAIARLPVDRSFTVKGFGTVVTGTLSGGCLQVGDTLYAYAPSRNLRVRGLQVHGQKVDVAAPGQRVAVNLASVEASDIARGDVLTPSELVKPSRLLGVRIEWLGEAIRPSRRERTALHLATSDVLARITLLENDYALLWLVNDLLAFPGDRFVLRRLSPSATIAGGVVVDAFPKRRNAAQRLTELEGFSLEQRIATFVGEAPRGRRLPDLVRLTARPEAEVKAAVERDGTLISDASGTVFPAKRVADERERVKQFVTDFHARNKSAAGVPVSELHLAPELTHLVLSGSPDLRFANGLVSLATHKAQFSEAELKTLAAIEGAFRKGGLTPPSVNDVLNTASADARRARALLEVLVRAKRLVRVGPDFIFHADAIASLRNQLDGRRGKRFSVPEFKQWTQVSRKYAIPLLEFLDNARVTRRDGDDRVVL